MKSRPSAAKKRREKIQRRAELLETRLHALCFRVELDGHAGELTVLLPGSHKRVAVVDLVGFEVDVLDLTYLGGIIAAVNNARRAEAKPSKRWKGTK